MMLPKVGFLRPIKEFGSNKKFFWTQITQTIDFLKRPDFRDLTKHVVPSMALDAQAQLDLLTQFKNFRKKLFSCGPVCYRKI